MVLGDQPWLRSYKALEGSHPETARHASVSASHWWRRCFLSSRVTRFLLFCLVMSCLGMFGLGAKGLRLCMLNGRDAEERCVGCSSLAKDECLSHIGEMTSCYVSPAPRRRVALLALRMKSLLCNAKYEAVTATKYGTVLRNRKRLNWVMLPIQKNYFFENSSTIISSEVSE